jgi:hypothetical protein
MIETVISETILVIEEGASSVLIIDTDQPQTIITANEPGPQGVTQIEGAVDVDATNKENGSVLVYSDVVQKWVATTLLENQSVESGHY